MFSHESLPSMPFPVRIVTTAVLAAALSVAAPVYAVQPAPLDTQIARLVGLLGDSYTEADPKSALVQTLDLPHGRTLKLAAITISHYGGGTNYRQYLALFEQDRDDRGPREHFTLLDVMQVGAKGWRMVRELNAEARLDAHTGKVQLRLPVLVNTPSDVLHSPSRKASVQLEFDRELREVNAEAAP